MKYASKPTVSAITSPKMKEVGTGRSKSNDTPTNHFPLPSSSGGDLIMHEASPLETTSHTNSNHQRIDVSRPEAFIMFGEDAFHLETRCLFPLQHLNQDELRDVVLLVFANKQDLPHVMNAAEITDKLGIHSLRQRHWKDPKEENSSKIVKQDEDLPVWCTHEKGLNSFHESNSQGQSANLVENNENFINGIVPCNDGLCTCLVAFYADGLCAAYLLGDFPRFIFCYLC